MSLRAVLARLDDEGVPALRLAGRPDGEGAGTVDVLVRPGDAARARAVLDRADWRTEVGALGVWRLARRVSYSWDDGRVLHLHWGLPAAPLPSRCLARLEVILWEGAVPADGVREAAPEAALVQAAVQVVRPGFDRRRWREEVVAAAARVREPATVAEVAGAAGVTGSVRRGLAAAAVALPVDLRGDGLVDRAWAAGRLAQRAVPRRRFNAVLGGTPLLGRTTLRTRFAGLDLVVGPGVFQPMPLTEHLVSVTLARLDGADAPVVVEVGTGCGAVALAVARRRPDAEVHASDLSRAAVRSARVNARRLAPARGVHLYRGSLLDPFPARLEGRAAAVVANLPYVPPGLRRTAWGDTPGAIEGEGEDGLGLLRTTVRSLTLLRPGGSLVVQLRDDQWEGFARELAACGYRPGEVAARSGANVVAWATRT